MEKSEPVSEAFSYDEAVDIAEDFEDLVGTDFGIPSLKNAEVEYVCVAPYDENRRNMFLADLRSSKDPAAALAPYLHPGSADFDVLVIGSDSGEGVVYTIRAYVQLLSLNYKFPGQ